MGPDGIRTIGVIGAGTMGRQIAMVCAMHGYTTLLTDSSSDVLQDARLWSDAYLLERIRKGRIVEAEAETVRGAFRPTDSLEQSISGANLVIEAVIEDRRVKQELFRQVDGIVGPECLLASNSSFMNSSSFAEFVRNPSRLANLHFFHPALVMELVEVVKGDHTSALTIDTLMAFCRGIGKVPVLVRREIEGFIANRILLAINDAALELYEGGYATPVDIDLAVTKGLGHPKGPFALMDMTGLDLSFRIKKSQYETSGIKPFGYDALAAKIADGEYGVKSGRGWFTYPDDSSRSSR